MTLLTLRGAGWFIWQAQADETGQIAQQVALCERILTGFGRFCGHGTWSSRNMELKKKPPTNSWQCFSLCDPSSPRAARNTVMADRLKEISAAMVAATAVPLALNWTDVIKTRMQGVFGVAVGVCFAPEWGPRFSLVSYPERS